jgi:ribosomal protein L37AE/L43A
MVSSVLSGAIMDNEATACIQCGSKNVRVRKTKTPPFLCGKCGHEFSRASVELARRGIPQAKRRPYTDREK